MSDEQEQPAQEKPEPKAKKRSITPAKWAEIEHAWTHGKFAELDDLAEHFGVKKTQLVERFRGRKIRRGAAIDAYNRKVQEELAVKAAEEAKILAERIQETRNSHYSMATNIARLTFAEIATARTNNLPVSSVKPNLQSLELAMKTLKMAREERFAVLGLNDQSQQDDDEAAPELVISELSAEQIEELRSRDTSGQDEDGLDDVVVIGDDTVIMPDDDGEELDG